MKAGRLGSLLSQEHMGPSSLSFSILFSTWNAFFFALHPLKYYSSLRSIWVPTTSVKLFTDVSFSVYNTHSELCNLTHNALPWFIISYCFMCAIVLNQENCKLSRSVLLYYYFLQPLQCLLLSRCFTTICWSTDHLIWRTSGRGEIVKNKSEEKK